MALVGKHRFQYRPKLNYMTMRKKAPPAPTRAVCYVRISVDRDEETSTDTQEAAVRAYCAAHGWAIVDVLVEAGRSAYKASRSNRPKFLKARAPSTPVQQTLWSCGSSTGRPQRRGHAQAGA